MATPPRTDSREDGLNDSWVELNVGQQQGHNNSGTNSGTSTPRPQIDRMLILEALREGSSKQSSKQSSVKNSSSHNSPESPHSPNSEWSEGSKHAATGFQSSDWIWDWSSRPEAQPPSDLNGKYKHPSSKRHRLSVRNTSVMKSQLFSLENLPTLLITHACTFFLGAATMFMFLKKYCGWSSAATVTLD